MTKRGSFNPFITAYIVVLIVIIYAYPRWLVSWGGPEQPWTNYLYHYGFGLAFFGTGLCILLKTGACRLGRGHDRHWFNMLVAGFIGYATVHAVWILLALKIPSLGAE